MAKMTTHSFTATKLRRNDEANKQQRKTRLVCLCLCVFYLPLLLSRLCWSHNSHTPSVFYLIAPFGLRSHVRIFCHIISCDCANGAQGRTNGERDTNSLQYTNTANDCCELWDLRRRQLYDIILCEKNPFAYRTNSLGNLFVFVFRQWMTSGRVSRWMFAVQPARREHEWTVELCVERIWTLVATTVIHSI